MYAPEVVLLGAPEPAFGGGATGVELQPASAASARALAASIADARPARAVDRVHMSLPRGTSGADRIVIFMDAKISQPPAPGLPRAASE